MKDNNQKPRQPIVVILGHVDHGKTSLLDYIRKTQVQKREAGGITQSIGASVVETPEKKKITFIDTPGHSAFSNMRERGAKLADIAVLVVAANDGVKPQTKEALEYILASKIPFIVAVTKMDVAGAATDLAQNQLEQFSVMFEGKGGDVPLLGVSVKTGQGVKELLDTILLVAELNGIKADAFDSLEAGVIETSKEKSGPMVSVVVKNGTLRVSDILVAENSEVKVRGLFDQNRKPVKEVFPGEPAAIMGFSDFPPVGSTIWAKGNKNVLPETTKKQNITAFENKESKLKLLIKASNAGSLEAVLVNLPQGVSVVGSGVGDVTDSDVFVAKSDGALIFIFESKVPGPTQRLADTEGVKIEKFDIIYHLFERVEEILKKGIVETLGSAVVVASFPYEGRKVAGCKVVEGKLNKNDMVTLQRGEEKLGEVKILSIRKLKQETASVSQGEECGIFFAPQLDFEEGDMLISTRRS